MEDEVFTIPMTGAWKPRASGMQMGAGDFRTLTNMRYTQKGIRGVKGMSKVNTTLLVTPGSYPDNFVLETFETSPGYDWGTYPTGWEEITGPGPADPDHAIPGGITDWGSECFYGSDNISEISFVFTEAAHQVADFSFGFDVYGDYNTAYSYGAVFWKAGVSFYNVLIEFNANTITMYMDTYPNVVYTAAIATGKHRIAVHANVSTGAWELKIDGSVVGNGTQALVATGIANKINISTDNGVYFDNVWFVPGEYEWTP